MAHLVARKEVPVVAGRGGPVVVLSPQGSGAGGRPPPGLRVARPVEGPRLAPGRVRATDQAGVPELTHSPGAGEVPHLEVKEFSLLKLRNITSELALARLMMLST